MLTKLTVTMRPTAPRMDARVRLIGGDLRLATSVTNYPVALSNLRMASLASAGITESSSLLKTRVIESRSSIFLAILRTSSLS